MQVGRARAGSTGTANRSISWPLSPQLRRQAFSTVPFGSGTKKTAPLALRLVAFRKPADAAEKSRAKARHAAKREGYAISSGTLAAAEWLILVTSLKAEAWSSVEIGELYRARWRIEMAFKRLKSILITSPVLEWRGRWRGGYKDGPDVFSIPSTITQSNNQISTQFAATNFNYKETMDGLPFDTEKGWVPGAAFPSR